VLRNAAPSVSVAGLAGLGRRMPFTAFGLVVAGSSLIGVPGTAGFITKWYLIVGALEQGLWWLVAAVLLSSLIAVAYVWRVLEAAYLRPAAAGAPPALEAPAGMLSAGLAMAALCVYFGFETSFSVGGASEAAALLLRGMK
jgi:multicomponent Na+:H+ antiporter subunit D